MSFKGNPTIGCRAPGKQCEHAGRALSACQTKRSTASFVPTSDQAGQASDARVHSTLFIRLKLLTCDNLKWKNCDYRNKRPCKSWPRLLARPGKKAAMDWNRF